ncbi:MAG: SAM-dependent DNA methyltransferase [Actinobacteria bacterium]|nr:SAM-dependent DNA methyltransferase [Actinomycetota bacterium]
MSPAKTGTRRAPSGRGPARGAGAPPSRSAAEQHRAWLRLVDTDGPFLAVPPLKRRWSTGVPLLARERNDALRAAKPAFDRAYDAAVVALGAGEAAEGAAAAYRPARDVWVETLLRDVFGWGDLLHRDDDAAASPRLAPVLDRATITSGDRSVTRRPIGALLHDDAVGALVWAIDPVEDLRRLFADGWAQTPIDAMTEMLRAAEVPIGLVTDGRWWGLVSVPRPNTPTAAKPAGDDTATLASSGVVDALTFVEETDVRDAVAALLDPVQLLGGRAIDRTTALFVESVAAAEDITLSLGVQVRRAVELLIQAFAESAADARRRGMPGPLPIEADGTANEVYQAAVTVMMRVVFLLFAQERHLLPDDHVFTAGYGLVGVLDDLDRRLRDEGEESLDDTRLVWHRLLATSNALAAGVSSETMRIPAYGGSLFDPARFGFLTATDASGQLVVTVSDLVMRHVLDAVQVAVVKGEARRVSFREIDVEQIGYIYEQLLGYTARRVETIQIGLPGPTGQEAEIPIDVLDELFEANGTDTATAAGILAWAKTHQPGAKLPSATRLGKDMAAADTASDATERALRSVTTDPAIRERLAPWIGLVRPDLRNRPTVFLPGGLMVVETPSRSSAGAHYTPRVLAEEVVEHALAPLVYSPGPHQTGDREAWRLVSSEEILGLKVADIACGSGAFLVAAARYLARRLVEAWEVQGDARGHPPERLELEATREVVARCLYGADINPMAVEMCKLSLWLVSLDPKLPFSFVDDKLFVGNSLLGLTDVRQIEELHLDPETGHRQEAWQLTLDNTLLQLDVRDALARAARRREALASEVQADDPQRSARAKARQLDRVHADTADVRLVANAVVATGLPFGGKPGTRLDDAYDALRSAVATAFPSSGTGDPTELERIVDAGLTPTVLTDYVRWRPLHWVVEVPDVMERGGFDAIIGNPPFLGGKKISGASGTDVREWLVNAIADGTKGNADLVAYFFLRAATLLNPRGAIGLIATNTVAQGDTREVGLDRMVGCGFTITRAIQSRKWPAASANLEYAAVWGTKGSVSDTSLRVADDVVARRISSLLEPSGRVEGAPKRLRENAGIAFIGCYVLGMGFVIDEAQAHEWIAEDPRNADVLFPYLNGEDLNSRPDASASRWVIDFNARTLEQAARYTAPFHRIEKLVRPERQQVNRKTHRDKWWVYADKRPALREAMTPRNHVLCFPVTSRTMLPTRVPTGQILSHALAVLVTESDGDYALLSSSPHQSWSIKFGSGMKGDPRYIPSDCFVTFPRPRETIRLAEVGRVVEAVRRPLMLRRELGLTKLYNLVNDPDCQGDPDIDRLREIHVEIDEAVMEAYGWTDVPLNHGFHTYRQMRRWTICPEARVEVLDRLLEENHRRAAAQGDAPEDATGDTEDDAGDAEVDGPESEGDEE